MRPALALVLAAAVAAIPCRVPAQEEDIGRAGISLEDFRLDAPPALTLLGRSGTSVARPNTPRALIASLVSGTGSNGLVPNGFALETTPFWLKSHPSLSSEDYYHASLGERLKYFTAFSAATSRHAARNDSVNPDARVSVALRTLLSNGRPSGALVATMDSMRTSQLAYISRYRRAETLKSAAAGLSRHRATLAKQEDLLSTLVTRVLVGPETELRDSTLRTLARRDSARAAVAAAESAAEEISRIDKDLDNIESKLARLGESFAERDLEPDGLVIELAIGTRARFTEGEWSREHADGIGLWLTPMYRVSARGLEMIAVGRYLARVAEYDGRDLLDLGGRLGLDVGRGALSAEIVNRSVRGPDSRNTASWSASFNYPLPAKLQLVTAFGSDFQRGDGSRPVIATVGINLGLGAVMIVPSGRNAARK